ncbi:MAG: hypothetical protein J7L45_00705 [Candidatus Aenigmarchaeota archaeon]|nr:hypothetical protein [Candidatus Aenigmarchaeota archaeon]
MKEIPESWVISKDEWKNIYNDFLKQQIEKIKKHVINLKSNDMNEEYFSMKIIRDDIEHFLKSYEEFKKGSYLDEKEVLFYVDDEGVPGYAPRKKTKKSTYDTDNPYIR